MLWLAVSNPYGRMIRTFSTGTSPDLRPAGNAAATVALDPASCRAPHCLSEYGATDGYPPRARTMPCPGEHKTHGRRGRDPQGPAGLVCRRHVPGRRYGAITALLSVWSRSPDPAHELRPPDLCIFFPRTGRARATTRFLVRQGPSRSLTTPWIGDNADGARS
jgi:hypothetical protein